MTGGAFDYLFLGGTVLACAAAEKLCAAGKRCLVVEGNSTIGSEFAHSLRGFQTFSEHPALGIAACYPPALTAVLSARLLEQQVDCRLSAALIAADENCLTFHTAGGEESVYASCIIDTTTLGILFPFSGLTAPSPVKAAIHARVLPPAEVCVVPDGVLRGALKGTYYISLNLPKECPPPEGMLALHKAFLQSDAFRLGWRLAAISFLPDLTAASSPVAWWQPSAAYSSAESAYDAGDALADHLLAGEIIAQPALRTPSPLDKEKEEEYDLIVAGLGTAGSICAIAAAESGLRVLALEPLPCLGGTKTAGGVVGYYRGIPGGIFPTIDDEASAFEQKGFVPSRGVNAVCRVMALYARAAAAGINMRFGAACYDVLHQDERTITGVRYVSTDGLHLAHARFTVDATGNADLCIAAGCAMRGRRALDGSYHLFSQVRMLYHPKKDCISGNYRDEGLIDPYAPTNYAVRSLAAAADMLHGMADKPECYMGSALMVGVREGQLICGEESVTLRDVLSRRVTTCPVFYARANLDNHGKDVAFESRTMRDWLTVASMWGYDITIPIPAGALIPQGFDGLLAAGRILSIDHDIASAVRMACCMQKSGEAAAALAVCAIRAGCTAQEVNYADLRAMLWKTGCLDSGTHPGIGAPDGTASIDLGYFDAALSLASFEKHPYTGLVLWTAALDDNAQPMLHILLNQGSQNQRRHAALALALRDDDAGEAEICAMIADRSGELMHFSWTYNSTYAMAAMSAAGRLRLRSAVKPLLAVITESEFGLTIPLTDSYTGKTKLICDTEDMRFQHYTHAFAALCEIAAGHPDLCPQIHAALENSLNAIVAPTSTMIGQPSDTRISSEKNLHRLLAQLSSSQKHA